ncbi:MAG: trypsin-like peptidase domain-containing protein [Bdellovibrionales bacterium]
MKRLYFLLFFLPFVSYSKNYAHPKIRNSVFRIYNPIKSKTNFGTLFYIGENQFVTNAHLIIPEKYQQHLKKIHDQSSKKNSQDIIQEFKKTYQLLGNDFLDSFYFFNPSKEKQTYSKIYFKEVLHIDFKNDLAVLTIDKNKYPELKKNLIPLKIASIEPNIHQKGVIYGYPATYPKPFLSSSFREIKFETLYFYNEENFYTSTNNGHLKGSSGGPVIIDGKVRGVFKAGFDNLAACTPSQRLIELLKKRTPPLLKEDDFLFSYLNYLYEMGPNYLTPIEVEETFPEKFNIIFQQVTKENQEMINEKVISLQNFISKNPNIYWPRQLLARFYFANKNPQKAFELLDVEIIPKEMYHRAYIKLFYGYFDEALKDLKESADWGFAPSFYALSIYYAKINNKALYEKYNKEATDRGHFLAAIHLMTTEELEKYKSLISKQDPLGRDFENMKHFRLFLYDWILAVNKSHYFKDMLVKGALLNALHKKSTNLDTNDLDAFISP